MKNFDVFKKSTPLASLKAGMVWVLLGLNAAPAQELSRQDPSFAQARAPRSWQFPRDHGKHEEFQTEWWYYTGNLRNAEGRRFGYQLTFFRNALVPEAPVRGSRWAFREGYVAHFTITDIAREKFYYDQRMSRGALALAAAAQDSLAVHLGSWSASGGEALMRLRAESEFGGIALNLSATRAPVRHGKNGFVQKGAQLGEASHYYSQPNLKTSGFLTIGAESLFVEGISWMDHEFFTNPKPSEVAGWDWFSVQLSDSTALMLYLLRKANGELSTFSAATVILSNGSTVTIPFGAFEATPRRWWRSAATGGRYPVAWQCNLAGYALQINAPVEQQELDTRATTGVIYWEGYIEVLGKKGTQPITGVGYLEMTGYASRVDLSQTN